MKQYRIEGLVTTRWYNSREQAWETYMRNRVCRGPGWQHRPGDVNGDTHEQVDGQTVAIHGVRDGHATVTLRIRGEA
jgi:hypothetical protein